MSAELPKTVKTFDRGAVLAEEGSPSGGWYVLLDGRVAVFKQGIQIAEFSKRGMIFGEISSILDRPRTARLLAVEPTSVIHFEASVDELVTRYPAMAKTMLVSLAQRLERTTDALWVAVQSVPPPPPPPPAPVTAPATPGAETPEAPEEPAI